MGAIFSRDQKAYDRWSRSTTRLERGLVGPALEQAVMRVASMFPDNVIRGVARG